MTTPSTSQSDTHLQSTGGKNWKGWGGGEESIRMGQDMSFCGFYSCNWLKYKTFFVVITPCVQLFMPPLVYHWIWESSVAQRDQIAAELEKLDS